MLHEQFLKWIRLGFASNGLHNYTFFTPVKWNQGCFDAAYYCAVGEVHHVYFFQCTLSVTHEYKSQWVANFLQHLSHCLMGWLHEVWVQHLQHWKCISMYSRQKKKQRCFTTELAKALGWFRTLILHLLWTGWRSFTCHRPRWCIIEWIYRYFAINQPTWYFHMISQPNKLACLLVCVFPIIYSTGIISSKPIL